MNFWKYQALGNDFIIIEDLDGKANKSASLVKTICDRHFGVGADGVLYLQKEKNFRMKIMNSDGGEAEMCGNGSICMGRFLLDRGLVDPGIDEIKIETLAGSISLYPRGEEVRVKMAPPRFKREEIPMRGSGKCIDEEIEVNSKKLKITALSMGNPHAVVFGNYPIERIKELAPKLESNELFPKKTNVEFAKVISTDEICLTVYERGAGFTLACGTGACATCVAGVVTKRLKPEVKVHLPGGDLKVFAGDEVFMEGPGREVFRGETGL